MPVGSNLRVFKSHIQPIWEDEMNKEGGNWIVVPRPREVAGVLVFKELLLSIIGGDLDRYVNGIVLSIKPSDIITQIWLPTNKTSKKSKVQAIATAAKTFASVTTTMTSSNMLMTAPAHTLATTTTTSQGCEKLSNIAVHTSLLLIIAF